MWITTNEAAEIYARFLTARYGALAKKVASDKATRLRELGDADGARIWSDVGRHVEKCDSALNESKMALV